MKIIIKIMVSILMAAMSLTTVSGQIRIITDPDQHIAWERFDQFMESDFSGEEFFETEVNGKTFRFKIEVNITPEFLDAMTSASAVCFFGTKFLMAWFPGEHEPSWTDLVPGFYKKYKSLFIPVDFTPPQKKVPNLLRKRGKMATKKLKFYTFQTEELPK